MILKKYPSPKYLIDKIENYTTYKNFIKNTKIYEKFCLYWQNKFQVPFLIEIPFGSTFHPQCPNLLIYQCQPNVIEKLFSTIIQLPKNW